MVAGNALHPLAAESGSDHWCLPIGKRSDSSPVVVGGLVYIGSVSAEGEGVLLAPGERPRGETEERFATVPAPMAATGATTSGSGEGE